LNFFLNWILVEFRKNPDGITKLKTQRTGTSCQFMQSPCCAVNKTHIPVYKIKPRRAEAVEPQEKARPEAENGSEIMKVEFSSRAVRRTLADTAAD
jgi:hypothetical protein